jgi:citrate lyase subunit beta / citryl-CoA lyase
MDLLVRRSKLVVPLEKSEDIEKGLKAGADVIVLDPGNLLSDGKLREIKASLKNLVPLIARSGTDVFILLRCSQDYPYLASCILTGLNGIVFFGAESAADVQALNNEISDLERKLKIPLGTIQIDIVIDTAKGIWNVYEIVNASMRIVSVGIDTQGLANDLGIKLTDECDQFAFAKGRIVVAARSRENPEENLDVDEFVDGIQPHGLGYIGTESRQLKGSQRALEGARVGFDEGFRGSLCTALSHIEPLNEGFSLPPNAIARANKVLEVLNKAMEQGAGSASIDGKEMTDVRGIYAVKKIMDRADVIANKERLKSEGRKLVGKISGRRKN